MKKLFITGTDTGVGKTYIGHNLVKALISAGHSCEPRKPIETGCVINEGELIPADASLYVQATQDQSTLAQICPYRYQPPISPERAIRLNNDTVTVHDLVEVCQPVRDAEILLVEGAGGFYSPLCSDGLNADLAQQLDADIILVAEDRLGCINQILLTLEAIQNRKLNTLAVVLNQIRKQETSFMNNVEDLGRLIDIPIIAITNISTPSQADLNNPHQAIEKILTLLS